MITLTLIGKKNYIRQFPDTWNELSAKQLLYVAYCLFCGDTKEEALAKIAIVLSDMRPEIARQTVPEVIVEELMPLVTWVLEPSTLTEQKFPVLKSRWWRKKFYGPSSDFMNLRFGEFDAAERALREWQDTPDDIGLLYQLVAVLYRPRYSKRQPADDFTDERIPFNHSRTRAYAKKLARYYPPQYAFAILIWYLGCRSAVLSQYPQLFEGDGGEADQSGYFGVIRMIAKSGTYGDIDKVEQLYLYTTMEELEASRIEREAMEAAIESAKSNNT